MVYGESDVMPLRIDINSRIISFWTKLTDRENNPQKIVNKYIFNIKRPTQ